MSGGQKRWLIAGVLAILALGVVLLLGLMEDDFVGPTDLAVEQLQSWCEIPSDTEWTYTGSETVRDDGTYRVERQYIDFDGQVASAEVVWSYEDQAWSTGHNPICTG